MGSHEYGVAFESLLHMRLNSLIEVVASYWLLALKFNNDALRKH
jgi:hypothetical protein